MLPGQMDFLLRVGFGGSHFLILSGYVIRKKSDPSDSSNRRLHKPLTELESDGKKPSQLLQIRALAGSAISHEVLQV